VLRISCSAYSGGDNEKVPTVCVPATEASNHPDINFIEVAAQDDNDAVPLRLVPAQFLTFTMVSITIQVVSADSTTGLINVVVGNGSSSSASSNTTDALSVERCEISTLLSGNEVCREILAYLQNIEGMRFSCAPSGTFTKTCEDSTTHPTTPKQTLHSQHLLENTEPHSVAARALGQLAIAGGCPLSQPAANLQLMNTVATIARVIGAIWEKFGI